MEIPLNAQVVCTDGECGQTVYVLIDPVAEKVTHIVVRESSSPHDEYIIPVEKIKETIAETIRLHCSKAELPKMERFIQTKYIQEHVPDRDFMRGGTFYGMGTYFYLPYVTPEVTIQEPIEQMQIPAGEFAVRRGTRVEAKDGFVGNVDEFVINPKSGHITHIIMREGHLWGKKDVIIPLSSVKKTDEDTVYLKLDKQHVGALQSFPVQRRWS